MKRNFYTLILGLAMAQILHAQAPGGISSNLTMWMRSTTGVTTTGSQVSSWTYANDGSKSFTATVLPTLTTNAINGNPAIVFTGTEFLDGPTGANAPITAGNDAYTAFIVWSSTIVNDYQRLWEQRSTCNSCSDAFSVATWNDGHYGVENGTNPFQYTLTQPYTANTWHISQLNLKNTALGDLEIIDETNYPTPLSINTDPANTNGPATRSIADAVNRIGLNHDGTTGLKGSIAEIIVYNSNIDAGASRDKIFSYLSSKYGITLNHNLTSSGGAILWNTSTNTGYNQGVFGIGNDAASGLSVARSSSSTSAGISGAGNVIFANATLTTDGSFLFAGNDGGALTESTTGAPTTPAGMSILGRKWKVQRTGDVGNVDVTIDYTGLTTLGTPGNPDNFRMVVDAGGTGNFTSATTIAPASFSGNTVTYSGVALPDGAVFTFGSSATSLPVVWRSFTATLTGKNDITLNWSIDDNQNAKVYEVEHSLDGASFTKIGEVINEAGTKSYSFDYPSATGGTHYFRVHEVDLDGRFIYSKIVSAVVKTSDYSLRLLSNPVNTNAVDMEIMSVVSAKATLSLLSSTGSRLVTGNRTVQPGSNRFQLPMTNLSPGTYILQVVIGSKVLHQQVIKL